VLQARLQDEVSRRPEDEVDLLGVGGARAMDVEQRRRHDVRRRRVPGEGRVRRCLRLPAVGGLVAGAVGLVDGRPSVVSSKPALNVLKNIEQGLAMKQAYPVHYIHYKVNR